MSRDRDPKERANKSYCAGCREDYYNGQGAAECWSFKTAKVVTRWRLGWWTAPSEPGAFTKVKTHDCHHEPGQYAYYKTRPSFAVKSRR